MKFIVFAITHILDKVVEFKSQEIKFFCEEELDETDFISIFRTRAFWELTEMFPLPAPKRHINANSLES